MYRDFESQKTTERVRKKKNNREDLGMTDPQPSLA